MKTMNTFQQTVMEIKSAYGNDLQRHAEPKMLDAIICTDLPNERHGLSWKSFRFPSGRLEYKLKELGLVRCKKSEATAHLVIGTMVGSDFCGAVKNLWLRYK